MAGISERAGNLGSSINRRPRRLGDPSHEPSESPAVELIGPLGCDQRQESEGGVQGQGVTRLLGYFAGKQNRVVEMPSLERPSSSMRGLYRRGAIERMFASWSRPPMQGSNRAARGNRWLTTLWGRRDERDGRSHRLNRIIEADLARESLRGVYLGRLVDGLGPLQNQRAKLKQLLSEGPGFRVTRAEVAPEAITRILQPFKRRVQGRCGGKLFPRFIGFVNDPLCRRARLSGSLKLVPPRTEQLDGTCPRRASEPASAPWPVLTDRGTNSDSD